MHFKVIFLILSFLPSIVLSHPLFNFTKVDLPSTSVGPESITFDTKYEEEPYYTRISNGRIVKYDEANGFIDYAFTVPNRSKETCDGIGNNRPDLGPTCGRPLGIGFHLRTRQLFVADAYQGFVVIAPNQTVATKIAGGADGVPFKLPTGLDVDQSTGNVYFTDASSQYSLRSKACDGTNNPDFRPICGRPLGLEFFKRKNKLFIADAFLGLFVVSGTKGGLASKLATSAEGVPFKFLNGLTVDQRNGDVYFTDFSSVFFQSQINEAIAANDSTGRLLKFNYRNQSVKVLLSGLSGANGVAISQDCSYLLVAEYIANRTRRYWLSGRRASTSEVVATFQGRPDNIRRTPLGDFWVAVNVPRPGVANSLEPTAIRINGAGNNLQTFPLDKYYNGTTISEFLQRGVQYYAGSVDANFVGVFS